MTSKNSTFHTDQNRWENRDYLKEKKSPSEDYEHALEKYQETLDENEEAIAMPDAHESESSLSRPHPDHELELSIKELLYNSNKIDASDITVTVDKSNVTLSGSVKSQFERDYAAEVVKLVHGVGNVKTDIVVNLNPGILPSSIGRNP